MDKQKKKGTGALIAQAVVLTLAAVIVLLLMQIMNSKGISFPTAFLISVGIYVPVCALASALITYFSLRKGHVISFDDVTADMPETIYDGLALPIAICADNGLVLWHNDAFPLISPEARARNCTLRSITGMGTDALTEDTDGKGILWTSGDRIYRIFSKTYPSGKMLVWWNDVTVAETEQRLRKEEEPFIAYIVIDNLDELMQIEQENTASIASSISHLLIEWALGESGILKEFERNKFVFVFNKKALDRFIENKFSILDKIRWIPTGKSDFPATVSIGVSTISGTTLVEKDAAARSAIELALARGGDQAVVKSENGIEFIGGMTKSSQKRSTVKSRTVADKLTSLIYDSSNVLIMGHRYADFDAFGACIGIARLVLQFGNPCNIVADPTNMDLEKCYEMLKSLHPYDNMFITANDAMELNNSDTLLIIVDVNNPTQFESSELARAVRKVVFIDHHRVTGEFERTPLLHYIEPSASSTCELVSEILEQTQAGTKLSKYEANLMFAGIMLDTKRFVVNTGVRTFAAAQYLRGQGANPNEAQELFKTSLDDLIREAKFETNVQIYRKIIAISINTDTDNTQQDRIAAAKVADKLLTVHGVRASFAVCVIGNYIRISARSTGKINVQKILETLGGGGHYDSAATQMNCTVEEAIASLKEAVDMYLDS